MLRRVRQFTLLVAALSCVLNSYAFADWPQWGGPQRDFHLQQSTLVENWEHRRPRLIWQRDLGDGYSSILEKDGRLYSMYRADDHEIVVCLDAADGRAIWEYRYAAPIDKQRFAAKYGYGPRSTPLIQENRIFTVGYTGIMHAIDARDGRVVWQRDLLDDFDGNPNRWGYACSPLAYDGGVIMLVGGKRASVVSLEQTTGRVRWQRHNYKNSYGSPSIIDINGKPQLICFMTKVVLGLNPRDGDLYWSHPHENQWDNNIVTPVWYAPTRQLFVTSEGTGGARMLQLSTDGRRVTELWHTPKLKVSHRNVIRIDDTLYFSHGDFGPKALVAVDAASGKVLWRQRDIPKAGLVHIGDHKLLMMAEDGRLITATVNRTGIDIQSDTSLLNHPAWTIPTVVGETLYLRDCGQLIRITLTD